MWESCSYMLRVVGNYHDHWKYRSTDWLFQDCDLEVREDQDHLSFYPGYSDLLVEKNLDSDADLVEFFGLVMSQREKEGWSWWTIFQLKFLYIVTWPGGQWCCTCSTVQRTGAARFYLCTLTNKIKILTITPTLTSMLSHIIYTHSYTHIHILKYSHSYLHSQLHTYSLTYTNTHTHIYTHILFILALIQYLTSHSHTKLHYFYFDTHNTHNNTHNYTALKFRVVLS